MEYDSTSSKWQRNLETRKKEREVKDGPLRGTCSC
jgi:hypothetical protein